MPTPIKTATFLVSSANVDQCPDTQVPEYAFIGRSNVGKSSLINMLTGRRALAMTSATPGKTMLINHFSVDAGAWHIVDLPGYGYARRSKRDIEKLQRMIQGYILRRQQMCCLFVLIDSRLEPQRIDLEFIRQLGENGVPFALIFTKSDKISPQACRTNVQRFLNKLSEEWEELPPHFVTSSKDGKGRDEVLAYIRTINEAEAQA